MCVATGQQFLKWPTTKGKVLFVNFEIPEPFMRDRIMAIVTKRLIRERLENLHIWNLRGHTADFEDLIHKIITRIKDEGYSLVILDPIYKGMLGRDENTASAVGILCNNIERVAVRTGAAVLYAHHFTKGNQANKEAVDRMSGSGVFARDADTIITFTPHDEEDCYSVELTLRNFKAQKPFVIEWDYPVMKARDDLDPDDLRGKGGRPAGDYRSRLLQLIEDKARGTVEWQKAAEKEGVTRPTFYREKEKLKDAGLIALKDRKWRAVRDAGKPGEDAIEQENEPEPEIDDDPYYEPEPEPGDEV